MNIKETERVVSPLSPQVLLLQSTDVVAEGLSRNFTESAFVEAVLG